MPKPEGQVSAGESFAGLRIEGELGRGGMSVLYRVSDERLGRPVALKVIAPQLSDDPTFQARFHEEAQAACAVEHPNVVPIYGFGEAEGQLYLAMRFVDGEDLRRVLRRGALAPARALEILGPIGDALDTIHARGLVHRDVKPENILLGSGQGAAGGEHVYLADFGLTRTSDVRLTKPGQLVGTIDYAPPEQLRGEVVDGRADVYALACVLYECLTGTRPFQRETDVAALYASLHDVPPPVSDHLPELAGADSVLVRGLAKDRDERPSTCRELLVAFAAAFSLPIRAIRADKAASTTRPVPPPASSAVVTPADAPTMVRTGRDRPNRRVLVALAVVVASVAAGAALFTPGGSGGGASAGAQRITFGSLVSANGLEIERVWKLTGDDGDRFAGTTTIENPTEGIVTYSHVEVIPKSLAASVAAVSFTPAPTTVVDADPVVTFDGLTLAPGADTTIRYTVAVQPGPVTRARLAGLAADQATATSEYVANAGGGLLEQPTKAPPAPECVKIPDVVGLVRDVAYPLVAAVGLVAPSDVHFPTSLATDPAVGAFAVVGTDPRPGRCVAPGSMVKVLSYDPLYCANPTDGACYDLDGEPVPVP